MCRLASWEKKTDHNATGENSQDAIGERKAQVWKDWRVTRVAAIDCGTNSIRLLVAETDPETGQLADLTRQMRIVRLGQGVDKTGLLDPAAIERTLEATREYREMIGRLGAERVRFVATSATRDAANRNVFVDGVRELLGIEPEVIPGSEEAALSFTGACRSVPTEAARPMLVVDIGGGSSELVLGEMSVEQSISINMGSVRVTEKFLAHCDPASGIDIASREAACEWIDAQLDEAEAAVDLRRIGTLVGVAGTVTTLTAQALGLEMYQPEKIDGAALSATEHQAAIDFMVDQPVAVKATLGFMPSGREDVIAAGALIWERIIRRVAARVLEDGRELGNIVTSEHDILDGIALSLL